MPSVVYLVTFLFSFASAITLYTNSSFIEQAIGMKMVAVIYTASAVLSITFFSRASSVLKRIGNRRYFFTAGAVYATSLLLLVIPIPDIARIFALLAYLVSGTAITFSVNIFFQHLEPMEGRGSARGAFLLLGNAGIMLGPYFAGKAIDMGGYAGTYTLSLGVFALLAIVVYRGFRDYVDPEYKSGHFETAVRHTLRTPVLRNVISANFILQFFYVWMIVYTPIYLSQYLGFSWSTIGVIFSVMLSTFIILDYPLGRIADYLGSEKELAALGFLIMAASVLTLAVVHAPSVFMVGALLFASRVGAATVEAMTEIHFYKTAKDTEPGLLALFSDLSPLSYIIAPILGTVILAFLPFQSIFAILGLILMVGFVVSLHLEQKTEWWVRAHVE